MRGRRVPPPPAPLPIWTPAQATAFMIDKRDAFVMSYRHDDGCPTLKSKRGSDCNCNPDVFLFDSEWRAIAQIIDEPIDVRRS